mgnify:CR=1 FL=1
MIDLLLEPFSYDYMFNAMWVSAMVGAVCAFLSCYLMLKGWSLIGDALSHSVVPGVAGAYMLGLPFALGAFLAGGMAAGAMLFLSGRSGLKIDVIIGIIFTAFFGLGLFMVSLSPMSVSIQTIIMGNILAIAPQDIVQLAIIGVVCLTVLLLKWKDLMVTFFDENHARSIGLRPELLKAVFFMLLSAAVVAAMMTVGAFLVIAMVVTPGATAYLWSDRLAVVIALAMLFGAVSAMAGYFLASYWDSSIAGAMVVVVGGIFLISLLFSPNQGVLARLWQRLQLSLQVAQDHMLLALVRRDEEVEEHAKLRPDELVGSAAVWGVWARMAFAKLRRRSLLQQADGLIGLSAAGEQEALRLLRKHRLWETYMNRLGLPEDHVHDPADAIEHFISAELEAELGAEVGDGRDPQGKQIPPSGIEG